MNTLFINSENSKISDPDRLSLDLTDKTDLGSKDEYIALSNLSIHYTWKNTKMSYKNNKFKISAPAWMKNFSYLMDHILYQIFKIILNICNIYLIYKNMGEKQLILRWECT